MLILPIKKKWLDMILSGEKKEESRELKPFYTSRFIHIVAPFYGPHHMEWERMFKEECAADWYSDEPFLVKFRNGYSAHSPAFTAACTLRIGKGNPDWGGDPLTDTYILTIRQITERNSAESNN